MSLTFCKPKLLISIVVFSIHISGPHIPLWNRRWNMGLDAVFVVCIVQNTQKRQVLLPLYSNQNQCGKKMSPTSCNPNILILTIVQVHTYSTVESSVKLGIGCCFCRLLIASVIEHNTQKRRVLPQCTMAAFRNFCPKSIWDKSQF